MRAARLRSARRWRRAWRSTGGAIDVAAELELAADQEVGDQDLDLADVLGELAEAGAQALGGGVVASGALVEEALEALAEQLDEHAHPRDRGAELVGDVGEEAALAGDELFDPLSHVVEGEGERVDLVGGAARREGEAVIELAAGDPLGAGVEGGEAAH